MDKELVDLATELSDVIEKMKNEAVAELVHELEFADIELQYGATAKP